MNQIKSITHLVNGKKITIYETNIRMKGGKKDLGNLVISPSDKVLLDTIRMFNKQNIEVLELNLDGSMKLQPRILGDRHIPRSETIKLLLEMSKEPYKNVSLANRQRVVNYLIEKSSDKNFCLNIRTYFKALDFFLYDKINWKKLIDSDMKIGGK